MSPGANCSVARRLLVNKIAKIVNNGVRPVAPGASDRGQRLIESGGYVLFTSSSDCATRRVVFAYWFGNSIGSQKEVP
jgi:hypothetical protein